MTLLQMRESEKTFLTPGDVADVLETDPNTIRAQAQDDPSKLGFPVIVLCSRVKIPRLPFLKFIGELFPEGAR